MKNITVCCDILALSLVVATLRLELDAATGHDSSSQHVAVKLLFSREAQNIEGILGVLQLFIVVN